MWDSFLVYKSEHLMPNQTPLRLAKVSGKSHLYQGWQIHGQ